MMSNTQTAPTWIYGTAWKEEATKPLVLQALNAGFTAIDTANQRKHYNEAAVGEALQEAGIERSRLFLQTKYTYSQGQDERLPYDPDASISEQVNQSFESSLIHLGTDYIDAYLLHGPMFQDGLCEEDIEVWTTMETLYRSGKIKALGVSNFSVRQLEGLNHHAGIKPSFIQNRCFAVTGWDKEVRSVCQRHNIAYQGFSLLTANTGVKQQPAFRSIADRTGMTDSQVIFQFAMKVGMIPLTGSSDPVHLQEDLACMTTALTQNDIDTIESIMLLAE